MILKLAGILFIMSSSVLAGLYYGNLETYRINDLMEFKKALSILKSEIEYLQTPLPIALFNIANRTKKPISFIFHDFARLISENKTSSQKEDISTLWEKSLKQHSRDTYFSKEDVEALISFGKTLGYLDLSMQSTSILVTSNYIDNTVQTLSESRVRSKKLFNSLGVLSGLLTIIIFI